jgi:2-keto-4-pentenoate hydratase/2-oxohepta-3-ene-1,7-dioic acid hydratase in catechol pathway
MHFTVPQLVSQISHYTTLQRGDVILTGTPGGVGVSSGRFLRAGQLVEIDLEGVGVLRNRVTVHHRSSARPVVGGELIRNQT